MSYLGIDTDNSDSLEFTEILEMFNENKIDIKMSEVKQIFKPYDLDKDGALNFLEFKQSALSPEADKQLADVMREIRYRQNKKDDEDPTKPSFIPMSFEKMIKFFCYKTNRKHILDILKKKTIGLEEEKKKQVVYQLNRPIKKKINNQEQFINDWLDNNEFSITDPRKKMLNNPEYRSKKANQKEKSYTII